MHQPSKRLFVSDLDGTLLQDDTTLSPYARQKLSLWLDQGLAFTIATARSIVSVRQILTDLPIRLPVVCANGAYLSDLQTGAYRSIQSIAKPRDRDLLQLILDQGFEPFLSTHQNGKDGLYVSKLANEAMEWYYKDRDKVGDERLKMTEDLFSVIDQLVISFNVMERLEPLKKLEEKIREQFGELVHVYFYENWYSPEWYWLSVYDESATKGGAIRQIMQEHGFSADQLTVFGDNLNDLSMFQLANQALAMENAVEGLKRHATGNIGTNQTDSVIAYLENATAQE